MTGAGPGRARRIGLAALVLWFGSAALRTWWATDVEVRLVPPYLPWPRAAVSVSGCGWPACVAPCCARPAWRCAGRALPRRLRAAHWRHATPPAGSTGPTASGLRPG